MSRPQLTALILSLVVVSVAVQDLGVSTVHPNTSLGKYCLKSIKFVKSLC
jgi:hypothetical protein